MRSQIYSVLAAEVIQWASVWQFYWPGYVECVSAVIVIHAVNVAEAQIAHRPDEHSLLHDAGTKRVHQCQTHKRLDAEVYNLTTHTQTNMTGITTKNWGGNISRNCYVPKILPGLNIATMFGMEKLEWCGYPTVKKFEDVNYSFCRNTQTLLKIHCFPSMNYSQDISLTSPNFHTFTDNVVSEALQQTMTSPNPNPNPFLNRTSS